LPIKNYNELLEGKLLLINKPLHWTSFDVIRKIRAVTRIKKIGHAGTLDPLATGLLIVCTGKLTKEINRYVAAEKEYTGTFTLGAVTPTFDLESEPRDFKAFDFITIEMLKETAKRFTGEMDQLPPIHSAIKQQGKPVYLLARKGVEVKLMPRKITIKEFEITAAEMPIAAFRVVCTTGTYIRSLAHDFGQALTCGAYLSRLCRTRIGQYSIDDSVTPEEFASTVRKEDGFKKDNRSQL
jgi:tRNA pseudouridine55 synthase